MDPLSLYPILPIILLALITMKVMGSVLCIRPAEGHFASIDGLRGYLAFFVFLHHSSVWYFFLHGEGWKFTSSNVYNHFGPTSVAIFFMITAFLFFSKLLDAQDRGIDWLRLYVSRALRILPLYLFAIFLLLLIVGVVSDFTLREPIGIFALNTLQWLIFIEADLNRLADTRLIIAGVVWSLAFEWLWYCTLPFIGLFLRLKTSLLIYIASLIGLTSFALVVSRFYSFEAWWRISPFLSGILAARLAREEKIRELASGPIISVCISILLVMTVSFYPTIYEPLPLLLLTVAFIGIACGNDLFGILAHSWSRMLGQISYSVYLLHGIVLFVSMKFAIGFQSAAALSPIGYWIAISLCSITVVIICSCTYRYIEFPALGAVPNITKRIKKHISKQNAHDLTEPIHKSL